MKKTINEANWTGNESKIRINKKESTVSLYGVCGCEKWETFTAHISEDKSIDFTVVNVTHPNWSNTLISGYYDKKDKVWYISNSCVSRENACVFTAIAQVLYNIL